MEGMGFSDWIIQRIGRAIDKACRGPELPLRAFWRKARVRFLGSPAKLKIKSITCRMNHKTFVGVG